MFHIIHMKVCDNVLSNFTLTANANINNFSHSFLLICLAIDTLACMLLHYTIHTINVSLHIPGKQS